MSKTCKSALSVDARTSPLCVSKRYKSAMCVDESFQSAVCVNKTFSRLCAHKRISSA